MGKMRKVGWAITAGKVDWRAAPQRAAKEAKRTRKEVHALREATEETNDLLREMLDDGHSGPHASMPVASHPGTDAPPSRRARPVDKAVVDKAVEDMSKTAAKARTYDFGNDDPRDGSARSREIRAAQQAFRKGWITERQYRAKVKDLSEPDLADEGKAPDFGDDDPRDGSAFSREVKASQSAVKKGWMTYEEYLLNLGALRKQHKRRA